MKTLFSLCLVGLIVTPLLPLASAHGVCTGLPPRFGRLDDVHFSSQTVQTGDTITITGNITMMTQQDLHGYLSIHSSPSPHARWTIVSTEPNEKMINVTQFQRVPFSMTVKALQPGTYKLSPILYVPEIGPAFSMLTGCNTEPVVKVTGEPICNAGFVSILKAEDGSSFCVKPDTAYILIHRGWAKEVSQTSLYTMPTISSAPCDDPYPQSNTGVAVLYMSPNSTGKICATYYNPDSPTQSSISVFIAKDMQQQASEITTSAYPDIVPTGNSTIVYTIKTGSQAGFYGMSFFCDSIPFVVGYDNQSRIILDDFPWLYKNDICLSQTNVFQITGLSEIHVKYVTQVHRN